MQAAYDVGLVAMRSTTESSRRSRERRCEEAITALSNALDAAGMAGATSTSGLTSSLSTAANDNLAATPATVTALSDAYRALVDFTTAFVSVDPAVAGTAPAASARTTGGGPIDTPTFIASSSRESFAAIESVFPRSAVASLRGLTRDELAAHASGVARLSLGARLFNWSEGRGGLGLEHVPSAAVSEAATLTSDVNAVLRSASASAAAYIDVWAAAAKGVAGPVIAALSASGTPPDESEWPSELANRRMLAVLTAALADDVRAREAEAANALSEWSVALGTLQRSVRGISTVSKDSVFPFFADLADAWIRAAGVRSAVAGVASLLRAILPYSAPQVCTLPETVAAQAASALGPAARATAAETLPIVQFAATTGETAYTISLDSPDATSALEAPIALQGFCPVALATPPPRLLLSTNGSSSSSKGSGQSVYGALLPGDPNHGVLVYNGTQYIVSSARAATAFLAAPNAYVNAALTAARAAPELVHLLQLLSPAPFGFAEASLPALAACDGDLAVAAADAIRSAASFSSSNTATPNAQTSTSTTTTIHRTNRLGATVADASVATPVHFIERHIDPRYSFSEWTLRRQALALANVRKCVTHSAQTDGSHFRRDNDAQVYLPRESGTQTRIDTGTTTDREPIQLVRVRGAREPIVEAAASRVAAGLPALP